jgi:hypothetical protein
MKKNTTLNTSDEWSYEDGDQCPLSKATLSVSGNGTKTGNCVLHFTSGASGREQGAVIVLSTLLETLALANQLSVIATQWEERLGNSQRS